MEKHEGMKMKNIDEIKAKFSSVKELKGREKLSDENLEKISGGYIEETLLITVIMLCALTAERIERVRSLMLTIRLTRPL